MCDVKYAFVQKDWGGEWKGKNKNEDFIGLVVHFYVIVMPGL